MNLARLLKKYKLYGTIVFLHSTTFRARLTPFPSLLLLRDFSRLDDRTSQRADYIEWLYSDEDEHRQEIDELWQKRMERLSNKKIKVIMSEQQNNSPIQAAVNALNGLCAFSRSE